MKLSNVAIIKTAFIGADFWIIRRGTRATVGTPVHTYAQYHIGVKVTATEILIPDYLFYCIAHAQQSGYFASIARGTLALVHITTDDIKQIQLAAT